MALPLPEKPKRPRGRPRKDGYPVGHVAPRGPAHGEIANAHTAAVVVSARRTEPGKAKSSEIAEAIAVLAGQPELKYLERAERLAWLCKKIDEDHVEHRALGTELVEVPTEAPQFKAMEMLQRTLGDYHHATEGAKVLNVINGQPHPQASGEVRRVIKLYLPPSAGS